MVKELITLQKENDEENAKLAWIKRNDTIKNFQEQIKWKEEKEKKKKELKELEKLELEEEIRLIKQEKEKGEED